jgi:hypothetical protein
MTFIYRLTKASITSSSLHFGETSQHFIDAITLLEQATRMDLFGSQTGGDSRGKTCHRNVASLQGRMERPQLVNALAQVYALTNEPDLAFRTLEDAIKMPASEISYGELKLDPNWDSIRLDPRFDKLLAQLAPNE